MRLKPPSSNIGARAIAIGIAAIGIAFVAPGGAHGDVSAASAAPEVGMSSVAQGPSYVAYFPITSQGYTIFPTEVGEIGEDLIRAFAVSGRYVYQAVQGPYHIVHDKPLSRTVLEVVDVSRPAAPRLVGRSAPIMDYVVDVAVADGYAYLISAPSPSELSVLTVVDVGNPQLPTVRGDTKVAGYAVAAAANRYAYVGLTNSRDLTVVDVGDPDHPRIVHSVAKDDRPWRGTLIASGGYLYGNARGAAELLVYDIHRPADTRLVARQQIADTYTLTTLLAVDNERAYLLLDPEEYTPSGPPSISVIDISKPDDPRVVHRANVVRDGIGETYSMAVGGHRLYLAEASGGNVVTAYDVEPLERMRVVGVRAISGHDNLVAVDESGETVFVTSPYDGLHIWRRGPDTPTPVGHYPLLGQIGHATVDRDLAFLTNRSGLGVIDIADRSAPRAIAFVDLPGPEKTVTSDRERVYVAVRAGMAMPPPSDVIIYVVDVSMPRRPVLLGSSRFQGLVQGDQVSDFGSAVVEDDIVWNISGWQELVATDMTAVASPRELSRTVVDGAIHWLTLSDDRAYIVLQLTSSCRLATLDIADPSTPTQIATSDYPRVPYHSTCPLSLAVRGRRVYALIGKELLIHDVTNPAQALEIGRYEFERTATSLRVAGDTAYVTTNGRLHVLTIRDPAHIREIGSMLTEFSTRAVHVDDYLYLFDHRLQIASLGQ
jgi:hypothetical protein